LHFSFSFAELSPTEQTNKLRVGKILHCQQRDSGRLATERRYRTPAQRKAERDHMKTERSPTTYLTIEELTEIAAQKLEEAAALAPGFQKEELLKSAENFRNLAEIKGWLSSDLKPPK
jgi:hypothetical protein